MNEINLQLVNVATWYRANWMAVNSDKTIIFHPKGNIISSIINLSFNNSEPDSIKDPLNMHALEGVKSKP